MSKCTKKYGSLIFTAALMIWLCVSIFCSAAFAEGNGAIKMTCRVNNTVVSGMTWKIYKVGERGEYRSSLCYDSCAPFDEYYVRIDDVTATHLTDMASTLENMAVLDKIPPLDTQVSDSNGELTFSGLEPGLYLLSGKYLKSSDGVTSYKPSPALVEITDSQSVIHVNAKIKALKTLDGEFVVHTVKKFWENDTAEERPQSITVEIYEDGELYETVELNEANNWTYRWETDEFADWRVKEKKVPDKYTVIYRSSESDTNENQYAIINTRVDDAEDIVTTTATTVSGGQTTTTTARSGAIGEDTDTATKPVTSSPVEGEQVTNTDNKSTSTSVSDKKSDSTSIRANSDKSTTTTTSENKLPQTGQLWWPVPVLSFGGIIFIAAGFRLKKKKDTE